VSERPRKGPLFSLGVKARIGRCDPTHEWTAAARAREAHHPRWIVGEPQRRPKVPRDRAGSGTR
jgi:hypothetical protein